MLYKKNTSKSLDEKLFKNPSAEYRAAPFWAWNCVLEKDELLRQIDCLKSMGFGGFHMHSRSGMGTKYLGEEFMDCVKECVKKAKKEDMLAWLYDEDRWSSGTAGGYVTKNVRYRERSLSFTLNKRDDALNKEEALQKGAPYLLGIYDVFLNEKGLMTSYKKINDKSEGKGITRFAYCVAQEPSGWFNGQTYLDTLNPEAVKTFIDITDEAYRTAVGEEYGKTVPAIFTDEPHFAAKYTLPFAQSDADVLLPWTPDFDETFLEYCGLDITEHLPELFWDSADEKPSKIRYFYHDHMCNRFIKAYAKPYGERCRENGIYLTGHIWQEDTLKNQTETIGEAMRTYKYFGLPGIDVLCDDRGYNAAKQAQSVAHQFGSEGVLSELYGVTNWDFDFRRHKTQGDWQAALGITVRVPHLSWVSMKGSAKRDYPASFNYQTPWYKEYSYIEDHFARLNTVLTRGKADVKVGVIHPVESYWLSWGPSENTADRRNQLDENFKNLTDWLLFGTIDFDFISEESLPRSGKAESGKFTVGEAQYGAIVVPGCITMRKTTLELLEKFSQSGGKIIFMGSAPKYIDVEESTEAEALFLKSVKIPFEKYSLLEALKEEREIEIRDEFGSSAERFICQMRDDNDCKWLFIAHARPEKMNILLSYNHEELAANSFIKIKGEYSVKLYDTLSGEIKNIPYKTKGGFTEVDYAFYANDSLLLRLGAPNEKKEEEEKCSYRVIGSTDFKKKVKVTREEENVCLLDTARYSLDGGEFSETEEILRIDVKLRKELDWPLADGMDVQPWVIEKEKITHFVTLEFKTESDIEAENTFFCAEELESLYLNGKEVPLKESGYFADKCIKKYALPTLKKGENIILAKVPFGKRISLEACYLTGDFGVEVSGCEQKITKMPEEISFGSIVNQKMPFYGGNLTYKTEIENAEDCDVLINASKYAGALLKVYFDGEFAGNIVFAPYNLRIKNVKSGKHTVEFEFFGNRYNTFAALHNCGKNTWYGPTHWYSSEDSWSYEYNLKETGILKSPVIKFIK